MTNPNISHKRQAGYIFLMKKILFDNKNSQKRFFFLLKKTRILGPKGKFRFSRDLTVVVHIIVVHVAVGLQGNHGTQIRLDFNGFILQMSAS